MSAVRIVSTKKLQPAQKQFLLNAGFSVVDADFVTTEPVAFSLQNVNTNLIFTSSAAVNAVANHPDVQEIRRNPVFCVGRKTADLLDEKGFTVLETTDYAVELAQIIKSNYSAESFTLFCGNLRLDTLPTELPAAGIGFNEIQVYNASLTPVSVGNPDGILFFSPSGIESYGMENEIGDSVCFCIGQTTASALSGKTDKIILANKPSVENVVIQAIKYFSQKTETDLK